MSIQELTAVVAPPDSPKETGDDGGWQKIEEFIGTAMPEDYREFGEQYGTGRFNIANQLHLWVLNPFSEDYVTQISSIRACVESLQSEPEFKYKAYPKKRGLLGWGSDVNGNQFYWLVDGPPDKWPVIAVDEEWGSGEAFERFDLSMTTFLAKVLSREIDYGPWSNLKFDATQVRFEQSQQPKIESEQKTLLQLYIENGNRADFWVQTCQVGSESHCYLVRKVCRKSQGEIQNMSFTGTANAIVDYYSKDTQLPADDLVFRLGQYGHKVSALSAMFKRIDKPDGVKVPGPEPKWRSICELYVENGNRAGFWIQQKSGWGKPGRTLITLVAGKKEGPLAGKPPFFNRPIVTMRHYNPESKKLMDERAVLNPKWAHQRSWCQVDPPEGFDNL